RPEREQNSKFGRPELPERDPKHADRMRRERYFDRQEVVGEEEPSADCQADVTAENEPCEDEQDAQRIQHMVDVEAIPWALVMTDARQRAVQAVAKPVH